VLLARGRGKFFGGFELDPLYGSLRVCRFRCEQAVDFAAQDEAVGTEGGLDDAALVSFDVSGSCGGWGRRYQGEGFEFVSPVCHHLAGLLVRVLVTWWWLVGFCGTFGSSRGEVFFDVDCAFVQCCEHAKLGEVVVWRGHDLEVVSIMWL
jgi:hypothetical protein